MRIAVIAIEFALSAKPGDDCLSAPIKTTTLAGLFGLLGAGEHYSARHPQPVTYDQYGMESASSLFDPDPDTHRAIGYAFAGASAITAAVATIEWVKYVRCDRK